MKSKIKQTIIFILCTIILINNCVLISLASEDSDESEWIVVKDVTDDMKIGNKFVHKMSIFTQYLAAQVGAFVQADLSSIYDNQEWLETVDARSYVVKNVSTGQMAYKIDKSVTDDLLNNLKEETKDTGGYTLMKTVKKSDIKASMFPSTEMYLMFLKMFQWSENGTVIVSLPKFEHGSTNQYECRMAPLNYYNATVSNNVCTGHLSSVSNKSTDSFLIKEGDNVFFYNPSNNQRNKPYIYSFWSNSVYSQYREFDYFYSNVFGLKSCSSFVLADSFDPDAPFYYRSGSVDYPFIVTIGGVSVPVFDSYESAIDYSVRNNLYYTSSDYTGEGREIIIPFDDIENITNGYYDGMYDMIQKLIEQQGGNSLTPEQLQQIVDEVKTSYGMLKDTIDAGFAAQDILIEKNSGILSNIADALNVFFANINNFQTALIKQLAEMRQSIVDELTAIKDAVSGNSGDDIPPETETGPDVQSPDDDINIGNTDDNTTIIKLYNLIEDGFDDVVTQLKKNKEMAGSRHCF